jgi:hypothetical protein
MTKKELAEYIKTKCRYRRYLGNIAWGIDRRGNIVCYILTKGTLTEVKERDEPPPPFYNCPLIYLDKCINRNRFWREKVKKFHDRTLFWRREIIQHFKKGEKVRAILKPPRGYTLHPMSLVITRYNKLQLFGRAKDKKLYKVPLKLIKELQCTSPDGEKQCIRMET